MNFNDLILGTIYQDKLTKVEGILSSKVEYLYGENRISLTPESYDHNKVQEDLWLSVDRLVIKDTYPLPLLSIGTAVYKDNKED